MNLLKWKLHLLWRSLTATEAKRVGTVMVALLLLVWIILAFAGIRSFFAFLVGWEENLEAPLAEGVLAVLYLVGLAVSLFTACGSAFVVMYSSSDLELLFAAPLPVGQVFTVKFFEILASVVTPMFFLTIPLMLGYGAAVGAGWQYYPAVLLLALFSLLWPTALGSALNLLVMRIVPPYQVREVGVALGSLLGGLIYAAIQFGSRSVNLFDAGQVAQMTGRISLAQVDLLPTWWLAQATLAAGRGDWPGFFSWAALVAGSALVFFGLSFFLVQEAFYGGWAGSGEVRRRKKVGSRGWGLGRRLGSLLPSSVVLAVAGKEIKMITRDLREWSQAIYMLVVMGAAIFAPMVGRGSPLSDPDNGVMLPTLFFFTFLFVAFLSSSLALSAVAREGKSWPVLRSSPLTGSQILWGKIVGITPLILAAGLAVVFFLTRFLGRGFLSPMAVFLLSITPGMVALNIAAGTADPKFDNLDPRKRVSISAFLLSLFLEVVYGAAVALALMLGAFDFLSGAPNPSGWLGFVLLLVTAIGAVPVSIALGRRSIEADDYGFK